MQWLQKFTVQNDDECSPNTDAMIADAHHAMVIADAHHAMLADVYRAKWLRTSNIQRWYMPTIE